MADTLFFYDLETSGFSPREQRIMQFGGQRTDMQLKPLGEPHNYFIRLGEDVLPDPDAVLLTGITPQKTISEGLTEAEFLRIFYKDIAAAGTIFVGFNSIRFDDEFMRFLHYRNFYDAYEWHWSDGRSRWDLLDVTRMTRALRPDGIKWPVDSEGKAANRLGLLTAMNGLNHTNAHDALSDVQATIALAQLLKSKQPKLFDYLLGMRDKKKVAALVESGQPFVYTSGKYASEHEKTTVVTRLTGHPKKTGALVYDLRHDPAPFLSMPAAKLAELWQHYCKDRPCTHQRLPVKTLQYNRCPAVAPLSVLDPSCQQRLGLSMDDIAAHAASLKTAAAFTERLLEALQLLDKQQQARLLSDESDVDSRLYDGFVGDKDKTAMRAVRAASVEELATQRFSFQDDRLSALLPLYKARNFPHSLSDEERTVWERFRERKLTGGKAASRAARYFERLGQLAEQRDISGEQRYLLEELQLYGQSILPAGD
ncbi:MAG TPA: exodeoxyribonuclease I [Candidatus Saccharimonadales bacterium]|nr:exodeoxyribonuclease I [Candidatus Saccharimonadales bacterium]